MGIGQKLENGKQEGREASAVETQSEAPKTLKEIGESRRMAVIDGGKKKWEGFKESLVRGKNWLKGKTEDVVDYALASPDAVAMGAKKIGQTGVEVGNKLADGAGYVSDKFFDGAEIVEKKAIAAGEATVEGVKFVGNKAKEGVVAIGEKAQEKYQALEARGKAAYENLSSRVNGAKNRFRNHFIQKKMDKLDKEESLHRKNLEDLQRQLAILGMKKQELIAQIV